MFSFVWSLLLLLLNFGAATTSSSTRDSAEVVNNFEVHIPVIKKDSNQVDDPKKILVGLSLFKLHLEQNSVVIHPEFTSRYFDHDGREISKKGHRNCFYHGTVEGHLDWQVTMSTCHGLQGLFGKQGNKTGFYHVEPMDQTNSELDQPHILYLESKYSEQTISCGGSNYSPDTENNFDSTLYPKNKQFHRRQVDGFYFVELTMINDFAQFNSLSQNISDVVLRSLAIANQMDILFRPLNIRIVLVSVETWTAGDKITYPMNNEATLLLDNLSKYIPHAGVHDATLLVTGLDLKGETLGTAFSGTMCDACKSIGLVQDRLSSLESIGSQASHELGHILNMRHDNGRECTCSNPTGVCIMAATAAHPPPTQWSSCSHSDLLSGFIYKKLNRCLTNEPTNPVADPVCGNGVREINEDCDCGSVEECTDLCCNASTCMLHEDAQCSGGPCCSEKCQFLPQNQTCRVPSQECDLVEHCSGKSSDCPQDLHKQDGASCGGKGEAFCFDGICQSLDSHCQRFFLTQSSAKECYTRYNIAGSRHGNCGVLYGQFVPCAPEHAQCGQLMCEGGTFQEHEVSVSVVTATRTTLIGSTFETCTSFSSSPFLEERNPGLVPDGIKCGDNSICLSQACTSLNSLQYVHPCPIGKNEETCSGEGVCNNLNECSCNTGFYGISCNESSITESSVDASKDSEGVKVIVGAVLGGSLLAAVLITSLLVIVYAVVLNSRKATMLKKRSLCSAKHEISQTGSQNGLLEDNPTQVSMQSSDLSCDVHHKATLS